MKSILLRYKLEFLLVFIATLGMIGLIAASLVDQKQKPQPTPQPTARPLIPKGIINESSFSPLFDTEIGKTTVQDLKKNPDIREIPSERTGFREFVSDSAFSYRENSVVTENSVVVFKRIIPINSADWSAPQISYYEQIYGSPEAKYTGSATYGRFMETYLYPKQGFAIIINPLTGEVFEIQSFLPTTVEDYLKKWGSDIKDYSKEPIEGP